MKQTEVCLSRGGLFQGAQEPDLGQYSQTNRVCPFYRYVGASLPATISIQALQVPTYQSAAPPKEASSRGRQVVAASQDRTYGFLYRQNPRAFTNFKCVPRRLDMLRSLP